MIPLIKYPFVAGKIFARITIKTIGKLLLFVPLIILEMLGLLLVMAFANRKTKYPAPPAID